MAKEEWLTAAVLCVLLVALLALVVVNLRRRRRRQRRGVTACHVPVPLTVLEPEPEQSAVPDRTADRVQASALVPRFVVPGEVFRIEAVLARRGVMARALAQLSAKRDDLLRAPARDLTMPVAGQTLLEITVECAQADVVTPRLQRLRWTGATLTAGFQLLPSANVSGRVLYADVNVFVDRVCVGYLPLTIAIENLTARTSSDRAPATSQFEVPRRLFMSYTEPDRAYVLPIARAMKDIGVSTFMDRLSLQGGEAWEDRLWTEIDACDCFMLFWSKESASSDWVQRETLRALKRQQQTPLRRPKIVTHLLGKPPPAAPPAALAHLHFNDPGYALWEAAAATGEA